MLLLHAAGGLSTLRLILLLAALRLVANNHFMNRQLIVLQIVAVKRFQKICQVFLVFYGRLLVRLHHWSGAQKGVLGEEGQP